MTAKQIKLNKLKEENQLRIAALPGKAGAGMRGYLTRKAKAWGCTYVLRKKKDGTLIPIFTPIPRPK
jgi:hypothetical protein